MPYYNTSILAFSLNPYFNSYKSAEIGAYVRPYRRYPSPNLFRFGQFSNSQKDNSCKTSKKKQWN